MDEYEEQHAGLGGGGGWAGFQSLVYDPKLSAGRGVQFSAAAAAGDVSTLLLLLLLLLGANRRLLTTTTSLHPTQEEVGALDDSVPVHYYPEGEEIVSASTSRPLDSSNKGFQLLQRLGWRGKGLGRNEHGACQGATGLSCVTRA